MRCPSLLGWLQAAAQHAKWQAESARERCSHIGICRSNKASKSKGSSARGYSAAPLPAAGTGMSTRECIPGTLISPAAPAVAAMALCLPVHVSVRCRA